MLEATIAAALRLSAVVVWNFNRGFVGFSPNCAARRGSGIVQES
jgi:hypothetical protein